MAYLNPGNGPVLWAGVQPGVITSFQWGQRTDGRDSGSTVNLVSTMAAPATLTRGGYTYSRGSVSYSSTSTIQGHGAAVTSTWSSSGYTTPTTSAGVPWSFSAGDGERVHFRVTCGYTRYDPSNGNTYTLSVMLFAGVVSRLPIEINHLAGGPELTDWPPYSGPAYGSPYPPPPDSFFGQVPGTGRLLLPGEVGLAEPLDLLAAKRNTPAVIGAFPGDPLRRHP